LKGFICLCVSHIMNQVVLITLTGLNGLVRETIILVLVVQATFSKIVLRCLSINFELIISGTDT
jgi:hypothetical protein